MQEMQDNTTVDTRLDLPNKLVWPYLAVPTYLMELWWNFSPYLGQLCHTPVLRNITEASIRVPRMFKSHTWQQYDKQMKCYK
jgi:hypothetical protein